MFKKIALSALLPLLSLVAEEPAAKPAPPVTHVEQTLSIIKPDAVANGVIGEILQYFEMADLKIVGSKMTHLSEAQVKTFYADLKEKPFFPELVEYMTSGPVIVQVLEGEDAIATNRAIMGATDPAKAAPGTIRSDFGTDVGHNAVHGSDSKANAAREIALFFQPSEIYSQQEK